MDIKLSQKILLINFWLALTVVLLMVLFYELEILEPTLLASNVQLVFVLQILMEIVTIAVIPLALKMFSFKFVHHQLIEGKGNALLSWGTTRLNLLCIPMLINTFLYYQVMSPAFGYMAIILFLCLFFVYPSMGRCVAETEELEDERH